eukprot:347886-Pelagomonas_calceolata.AAC.1
MLQAYYSWRSSSPWGHAHCGFCQRNIQWTKPADSGFLAPKLLYRTGTDLDLDGAASDFDEAWLRAPSVRPFLWQRGIALYFQSRFPEAADQFRSDVAVNPRNTEEAIWAFISEARMDGPSQARANFVQVDACLKTAFQ